MRTWASRGRGRRTVRAGGCRCCVTRIRRVTMVIAAGGPGLLVRVAALAGADRSGSRLCHYGSLSRRRGPGIPPSRPRTCRPHQHEDSLSSSCRRQQLPWTQMRQLCVGGRCRAATRPSDHNGGSSRDCYQVLTTLCDQRQAGECPGALRVVTARDAAHRRQLGLRVRGWDGSGPPRFSRP